MPCLNLIKRNLGTQSLDDESKNLIGETGTVKLDVRTSGISLAM